VTIGQGNQTSTGLGYAPGSGGIGLAINTTTHPFSVQHLDLPAIISITIKNAEDLLHPEGYKALKEDADLIAHECSIELGVQGVQDSVVNSTYLTEEIGFWKYGDPPSNASSNETLLAWWQSTTARLALLPGLNHTEMPPDGSNCPGAMCHYPLYTPPGFGFDHLALTSLRDFIATLFNGFCTFMLPAGDNSSWSLNSCSPGETRLAVKNYASADAAEAISRGKFFGCLKGQDYLICGLNNVAKAMTKTFRDSAYASNRSDAQYLHFGRTLVEVSYVRIDWMWMSMPILVWTMALLTSIGTAITTRRAKLPTWANNMLPLLFLYREQEGQESSVDYGISSKDYLRRASRMDTQLQVSEGKAKLM
jgi:hypothetical protein